MKKSVSSSSSQTFNRTTWEELLNYSESVVLTNLLMIASERWGKKNGYNVHEKETSTALHHTLLKEQNKKRKGFIASTSTSGCNAEFRRHLQSQEGRRDQ